MNKIILSSFVVGVFVMSGCQSMTDQLTTKISEGITEKVLEGAAGGDVKVDLSGDSVKIVGKDGSEFSVSGSGDAGSMIIKNADGTSTNLNSDGQGNFTATNEKGEVVTAVTSGSTRPNNVPADLPFIEGGRDFSTNVAEGSFVLGFAIDGTLEETCGKQDELLLAAGYKESATMSSEDSLIKTYDTDKATYGLTCAVSMNGDKSEASVFLSKTEKK